MKFSPAAALAVALALSARGLTAEVKAAAVSAACPSPYDPSSPEACTPVSSWSEFTSALSSGGGRVVLCPFSVVPAGTHRIYGAVDVVCAKSSPSDECEIVGGSSYHLDVRSTSVGSGVRLSGLTFRSAATTSVVVRYGLSHALCGCAFEDNSRPSSSGAGVLQYTGTELLVDGSAFRNNGANNGGAIYSKGDLKVADSTFEDNTATYGGAIKMSGGSLDLSGSTFVNNGSTKTGPAIAYYSSSADFVDGGENVGFGNFAAIKSEECNGFYSSGTCTDFYAPPAFLAPSTIEFDAHGSLLAYKSCDPASSAIACGSDWASEWGSYDMILDGAMDVDPFDARATMRGSGSISTSAGSDAAVFRQSPRLYVAQGDGDPGWENVEFTAYGMYVADPLTRPYSGLTLAARSDHAYYKDDGCAAPTYYAKIYRDTGSVAFIKEYYHDDANESVYADSVQAPLFEGRIPFGSWIGMKFVVLTVPGTSDVLLELYVDLTDGEDGGAWELVHSHVDVPGSWLAAEPVPAQCEDLTDAGETILGPRAHCFFRASGYDDGTEVHWKKGSIRNVVPELM